MLEAVLTSADEGLFDAEGEPIAWPVALAGDKGYRAEWIDDYLLELGMTPVIPSKENEDREARTVSFDKQAYRDRKAGGFSWLDRHDCGRSRGSAVRPRHFFPSASGASGCTNDRAVNTP